MRFTVLFVTFALAIVTVFAEKSYADDEHARGMAEEMEGQLDAPEPQ